MMNQVFKLVFIGVIIKVIRQVLIEGDFVK